LQLTRDSEATQAGPRDLENQDVSLRVGLRDPGRGARGISRASRY
jgi:hypothetical protein